MSAWPKKQVFVIDHYTRNMLFYQNNLKFHIAVAELEAVDRISYKKFLSMMDSILLMLNAFK